MLNDADASGFKKVYLAMGFTDLRRGIDGLATIVRFQMCIRDSYCIIEEPYKHYFTEKVSYSHIKQG